MQRRAGARAGEHLVEHGAERVDVGAMIDAVGMAFLFRRHVGRRAHDDIFRRRAAIVGAAGRGGAGKRAIAGASLAPDAKKES